MRSKPRTSRAKATVLSTSATCRCTWPMSVPAGTDMGHVHLQVADVDSTVAFARDVLGFDLMVALGRQAVFLSTGGYHHDIGANTWSSRGARPPPHTVLHLIKV